MIARRVIAMIFYAMALGLVAGCSESEEVVGPSGTTQLRQATGGWGSVRMKTLSDGTPYSIFYILVINSSGGYTFEISMEFEDENVPIIKENGSIKFQSASTSFQSTSCRGLDPDTDSWINLSTCWLPKVAPKPGADANGLQVKSNEEWIIPAGNDTYVFLKVDP